MESRHIDRRAAVRDRPAIDTNFSPPRTVGVVNGSAPPTPPRPIATVRLTRSVALRWLVGSVATFFAFAYGFGYVLAAANGRPFEPITIAAPSAAVLSVRVAAALVALAVVVVVHELVHGVVLARYGGEPRYGGGLTHFVLPYAYAGTDGTSYTRTQFLTALVAPFVAITAVGLAAAFVYPSPLLVFAIAANAAGSSGDLWMAAVLCRFPAEVRVAGLPEGRKVGAGFGVYAASADGEADDPRPVAAVFSAVWRGAVGSLAVAVTAGFVAVFASLAFGSGDVTLAVPGGRWVLLRHERVADGASLEVGAGPVAGLSLLGGISWALLERIRRRLGSG